MNRASSFQISILLPFLFISFLLRAQQPFPGFGHPYIQDEVTTIRIYLDGDSLESMIAGESDSHFYSSQFIYESSGFQDTVYAAGISLRGNTSLDAAKKSFKIDFNEFGGSDQWLDLEQLNLVAQQNDPSLLRSKLCHDMHRFMGVACSRTSFVKLYINDEYRGLYLNQEHIDEEFADKYFDGEGDGNLYKCTYPATLEYISTNPDDYKFANWGTRHYDLKTNEWKDDYSDLSQFINILNNTGISNLECSLQDYLDVDNFLRAAAVDVLCGNWDGYIYNKNNFYLYRNQETGLFQYIPYDMDNTLGIDWVGQDWTQRNIYNFAPSQEARPLFKRLLQVDAFRDRFSYYIQYLVDNYFNEDVLIANASAYQDLIEEDALADIYRTLDFGFDNEAFLDAITDSWGEEQVDYGIAEYIQERTESALEQLDNFNAPQAVVAWMSYPVTMSATNDMILITAKITGANNTSCSLLSSSNNLNYTEVTGFNDDGVNGDAIAGDNIFTYYSTAPVASDKIYFKIEMPEEEFFPCVPQMCWLTPADNGVYINEVMSSNSSTVSYNNIDYADWLELWNSNASNTSITGWYVTDNINNWNKFQLTSYLMTPGDFELVWLDDEPAVGPFHATFKLGDNDEGCWLITTEIGEPRIADHFSPCIAPTDMSQERITDGNATIAITNVATPNASNGTIDINEQGLKLISAYPNPADEMLFFTTPVTTARILDMEGRTIISKSMCNAMDISMLAAGIYIVELDHQPSRIVVH